MKYINLGNTDLKVSQLGLGCINFGTTTDEKTAWNLMDCYIEHGGNVIDTANNYAFWNGGDGRDSERVIGQYIKCNPSIREKMVLCTKLGALPNDLEKGFSTMQGNSRKTILEEVDKSLETLQTNYIDLLYLHVDDYNTDLEETMETLDEVIKKGYVKYIGCSNFQVWRIEQARQICKQRGYSFFSAVQQRYSYFQPVADATFDVQVAAGIELKKYIDFYKDITLFSHTSLLFGAYTKKEIADVRYQTKQNEDRLKLVQSQGTNAVPWVLNHITEQFGGSVALFTSSNVKHLKSNLEY